MSTLSNDVKAVDNDTIKFIEQTVLGDSHQEVYWKGWADIMYVDKKLKPRVLVISNFRLNVMKDTVMGHSIRQSFLFLNLKSMKAGHRTNQLILFFDEDHQAKEFGLPSTFHGEFIIEHPRIDLIAQCILFAASSIRYGRSAIYMDLPKEWLAGYRPPEPDEQDGMLATYLAQCDRCGVPQRVPVLDYLMTCFQIEDTLFDLKAALSFLDGRECTRDVLAIACTLKYTKWFNAFVAVDFPLKNDGCSALVTMFDVPTSINKLVLVNVRIGKQAIASLSAVLAKNLQTIDHIAICKNDIGDSGVIALCEGFEACKHVPVTLALSSVDMGSKGCKALAKVLSRKDWLSELRVLDISDNDVGKAGTESLASWLVQSSLMLEQCILCRTNLELEKLLATLRQNPTLVNSALTLLDISGNKLHKRACPELCSLLKHAKTLNCVCLADCHIESKQVLDILDAIIVNKSQTGFSLDLSKNDLGPKGARDIQQLLQDRISRNSDPLMKNGIIQFLDLSDNNFGNEGLAIICKAIAGTAIKGIKLDRNFKPSMFAKAQEAGDALSELLLQTPSLVELSIAGDDNSYYLSKYLSPLLNAICSHPSLQYLDIQRNRVGDEGIVLMAEALKCNNSLIGFNVDGSRMSLSGLTSLVDGLRLNKNVYNMTIPASDIDRIIKAISQDKVSEVQALIHTIDVVMDSNEPNTADPIVDAPLAAITSAPVPEGEGVTEGAPAVEVLNISMDDPMFAAAPSAAPRGSLLMRGMPASTGGPRGSIAVRPQRMSVAASSYEDMMAELKPTKTHRKMITRNLDNNVSTMQQQTIDDLSMLSIDESAETSETTAAPVSPVAPLLPPQVVVTPSASAVPAVPADAVALAPPPPVGGAARKVNIHFGKNINTTGFSGV